MPSPGPRQITGSHAHLRELDHRFVWHPFTQMGDWIRHDPIVVISGKGARLKDSRGRSYLDANASIWTNLHGHRHPALDRALKAQLGRIAHCSALGLANAPAAQLAERLVNATNPGRLAKAFFSDDGSTAMEAALKMVHVHGKRSRKLKNPKFLSLDGAYHGDSIGAVSLGHINLFHQAYQPLLFPTDRVMAPYCYRCPYNQAKPERTDARTHRRCNSECLEKLGNKLRTRARKSEPYAALVLEPLIQGAAGMIAQPDGWLQSAANLAHENGALLIVDEVMTGFGRTGIPRQPNGRPSTDPPLFACQKEGVQPDVMVLAKGLTGGYLPMAATLATNSIYDAFLGRYEEFKTFFHGHSYTGNPLAATTAVASLDLLQNPVEIERRRKLEGHLARLLDGLWDLPAVGDIRRVGLIAGIELVRNWARRTPFEPHEQIGIRVCEAMARRGVLTRPIGNVIVLMPPYVTTPTQLRTMVQALHESVEEMTSNLNH